MVALLLAVAGVGLWWQQQRSIDPAAYRADAERALAAGEIATARAAIVDGRRATPGDPVWDELAGRVSDREADDRLYRRELQQGGIAALDEYLQRCGLWGCAHRGDAVAEKARLRAAPQAQADADPQAREAELGGSGAGDVIESRLRLRARPKDLSEAQAKTMFKRRNFFAYNWNKQGRFANDFVDNGDGTVTDRATGLMWQQAGFPEKMNYAKAKAYVAKLNRERYAGHADWRLPTLEEGASLLESTERNGRYIDPVFDKKQSYIWTADSKGSAAAWNVSFYYGYVYRYKRDGVNDVRACRAVGQ